MIVKQVYTKKKKTVFQNTETVVETEQNQSEKIDDIKLDSEYVTSTDELESKDDDKTINSEENSEEK